MRPTYNELFTFLTALASLLVFVLHLKVRAAEGPIPYSSGPTTADGFFFMLGVVALPGFILSFYHVIVDRPKNFLESTAMALFVMGANGLAGIMAGIEILPEHLSWAALFPIWNIAAGAFSIYQIGLVNFQVTDENATIPEVLIGSAVVVIVFVIAENVYHSSLAMTFSSAIFYSSLVSIILAWSRYLLRLKSFSED